MNQTLEILYNHRTIRKFTNQKLTTEQIEMIIHSAQMASTSSHLMAYTIIGITDETKKENIYKISGQSYVKENGHLFIFCADLHRHAQLTGLQESEVAQKTLGSSEQFLVATIDASLAAQNACIAAESMGLGICYLGSIRNDIYALDEILQLPDYVVPLFGLAVGYPAQQPESKPRLPLQTVYHENSYLPFSEQKHSIEQFDKKMEEYYQNRNSNLKVTNWSNQVIEKYLRPTREDVALYLKQKKMNKN